MVGKGSNFLHVQLHTLSCLLHLHVNSQMQGSSPIIWWTSAIFILQAALSQTHNVELHQKTCMKYCVKRSVLMPPEITLVYPLESILALNTI